MVPCSGFAGPTGRSRAAARRRDVRRPDDGRRRRACRHGSVDSVCSVAPRSSLRLAARAPRRLPSSCRKPAPFPADSCSSGPVADRPYARSTPIRRPASARPATGRGFLDGSTHLLPPRLRSLRWLLSLRGRLPGHRFRSVRIGGQCFRSAASGSSRATAQRRHVRGTGLAPPRNRPWRAWRREPFARRLGRGKDGREYFRSIDPFSRHGATLKPRGSQKV